MSRGWFAENCEFTNTSDERAEDYWQPFCVAQRIHQGADHSRPTRAHDAGHERERDET